MSEYHRFSIDRASLAAALSDEPSYRVEQVWKAIYSDRHDPQEWLELPQRLRVRLANLIPTQLCVERDVMSDAGETVKTLWRLNDGAYVESVLMHYPDRTTLCVSSQVGCAMGCTFCATGQAGFTRHLDTGEIVEQVARARRTSAAHNRRLSNIVFMGMGEPLANEANLWPAIERIHSEYGLSARHITVSTVGLVPGIRALAHRALPVTLAVSLHAADDLTRSELVPMNNRYPIGALMDACQEYTRNGGRRISFEWALISDVNDSDDDAERLAQLCRQLRPVAHVNVIPLNDTPGYPVRGSSMDTVRRFIDVLSRRGVSATIRSTRGDDIAAACGQLAASVDPPRRR